MSVKTLFITVCSTKGGVGKTTTTANLAGLLADSGLRVLMVDADIQPTLSSYYPIRHKAREGLFHLVTGPGTDLEQTISQTSIERLDIVLSDDPQGQLENWILHTPDGRVRLKRNLRQVTSYDIVLVDTQGAVGPLQDVAVLAADLLLSPVTPEILAAREFVRGTATMLERLEPMKYLGAPVPHLYALIYRMDRTVDARSIAAGLRGQLFASSPGSITVLETVVPASVMYRQASTAKIPVHLCDPKAKEVQAALVRELLPHLDLGISA